VVVQQLRDEVDGNEAGKYIVPAHMEGVILV